MRRLVYSSYLILCLTYWFHLGTSKAFVYIIECFKRQVGYFFTNPLFDFDYVFSSLEMWYLHAPDRTVPYEVTFKAVNDLYEEGYFKRLGISNYAAYVSGTFLLGSRTQFKFRWEVAEIVGICKANGYIQPTAYQGIYNAVHRAVEPELLPCLRKFGISFYEFNPRKATIENVPLYLFIKLLQSLAASSLADMAHSMMRQKQVRDLTQTSHRARFV